MMMPITVKIEEIEKLLSLTLQKLKIDGIDTVEIDTDFYLLISTDEWEELEFDPKPVIGSLVDDWESLKKILQGEAIMTYLDFERLASILRALTEAIVPTASEEETKKVLEEELGDDEEL